MSHILASRHQFFQFFRDLLKWKQLFCIVETYFSIFFSRLVQTDILPSGNSIFWSVLLHWEKELILASGELIFWLVKIIFFSIFQRLLPMIVYFLSSGSVFFNKILHSDSWKRIFWLVETVFICSEVFSSSGNRHLN